jgi:hypothetical protein
VRLINYTHPAARFSLPIPEGWEPVEDAPGVALAVVEPERDGWFRSSFVVTIEKLAPQMTSAEWTAAADELIQDALDRYVRIDVELVQVGERQTRRVLAHHTTGEGHAVTMEQWALVDNGCGYTLTASAGTLDYGRMADLFAVMAEGFRPDPRYGP